MVRKILLPLFLFAMLTAAIVFAIQYAGQGRKSASPATAAPKLWAFLRWAAQNSAYGDDAVEAAGELTGTDADGILEFGLARFEDSYEDDDRAIRALYVLAHRKETGLVPRIRTCIEEGGEAFVGEWAARALAAIPGPEATAELTRLAACDDVDAKRGAILALAARDEPEARAALRASLADADEEIAAAAAGALAAGGEMDGAKAAEALLAREDDFADTALAQGLGATGSPAAAPLLMRLLERDSADVQAAAVRALGRLGDAAPRETLVKLLGAKSPDVRLASATVLARAFRSDAGAKELVRAADEEPDLDLRVEALRALADLRREADRRLFETYFRLPADDEVHRRLRIWAATALLRLGVR